MRLLHALHLSALAFLPALIAVGCKANASSSDDSQCRIDGNVICPGDFVGYSCAGDLQPTTTCGQGTTEDDGETAYCCGVQSTGACVVDTLAGCSDGSTGYSCTLGDLPSFNDPSLACSAAVAGPNGDELYCCLGFSGSTGSCAPDSNVSGCSSGSYGYSCSSTDTPDQSQTSLTCSSSTPGPDGALLFCCSTS